MLAISGAMIWGRPLECLVGALMIAAGLPFYFLFKNRGEREKP
jgi:hypothetical protein